MLCCVSLEDPSALQFIELGCKTRQGPRGEGEKLKGIVKPQSIYSWPFPAEKIYREDDADDQILGPLYVYHTNDVIQMTSLHVPLTPVLANFYLFIN